MAQGNFLSLTKSYSLDRFEQVERSKVGNWSELHSEKDTTCKIGTLVRKLSILTWFGLFAFRVKGGFLESP